MVRVPAIVWAAFLCGWLVLAVVMILAQYTNDAAQDGIQEFIEDSETMLQLTTVAVESTGAILTFYDTIVAPGMTGNISSMNDGIAAINGIGNITPACGFVNEVLRNVTDEVAANLTATYGLEVEASATMTDARMTVYESACGSVLQAAPAFACMSAFASGEVNTTISTHCTINSEMSDLQSKQQDALDFWTNLKPALYDSWIIGDITAALWTASFMPALIFGYRRNALKVRLGIPNAFEGCSERNHDKEFATYRCYYFVRSAATSRPSSGRSPSRVGHLDRHHQHLSLGRLFRLHLRVHAQHLDHLGHSHHLGHLHSQLRGTPARDGRDGHLREAATAVELLLPCRDDRAHPYVRLPGLHARVLDPLPLHPWPAARRPRPTALARDGCSTRASPRSPPCSSRTSASRPTRS